jgi:hypothetical protein
MSDESRSLPPGAIKDRQISGQAKIKHGKLAQVDAAQVLVGGSDKKLSAKTVSGDATLANDGTLTLDDAKLETRVKAVLTDLDIESGSQKNIKADEIKKIYEEIPGVNRFTNRYDEDLRSAGDANLAGTLVKRDDSGDISVGTVTGNLAGNATTATSATTAYTATSATTAVTATTATTATNADNADLLDDEEGAWYTDVSNHEAGDTETLGAVGTGLAGATNKTPVPKVVYEAIGDTAGSHYSYVIPHNFGYYPQVTVLHRTPVDPEADPVVYNYEEIDAEIESGTTSTTVKTSEQGLDLKIILT